MVTPEEMFGKWYENNEVIVREGDRGDSMFVVLYGEVEVSRLQGANKVVMARLSRGEFFGEMALIDNSPRSATVTAVTRTRVLPVSRRTLLERAEEDQALLLQMLGALSSRVAKATRLVRSLLKGNERLTAAWAAGESEGLGPHEPDSADRRTLGTTEKAATSSQEPTIEADTGGQLLFSFDPAAAVSVEQGRTIFRQGDSGTTMYFVIRGTVEILHEFDGEEKRLALFGPQDFFGEMALITGAPRTATAAAMTECLLLPVGREEFLSKVNSKPQLALFILQVLVSRLRFMVNKSVE
jgi:CRP-like cAMP-binding protein